MADEYTAETTWFHLFKDMVDNGDLARLDGSAIKVYLVVKSHAGFSTGSAFPSIDRIAKKSGLSERHVKRCLSELSEAGYVSKTKVGKGNVYSLREKIVIKDSEGKDHSLASWDYVPSTVKDAMVELKNMVMTGKLVDGKIIHIEHLTLNVANDHATQFNVNVHVDAEDLAKLSPDVQERLLSLKENLIKRGREKE